MPNIEKTSYDDDIGGHVLPDNQRRFMEWCATPSYGRVPPYATEWAAAEGLAYDTVRKWKQKPVFKRELEKLLAELNVSPDRLQKIVETLYKKATDSDDRDCVKSAQLYMQYVDKLQPTKVLVQTSERDTAALSDEELRDELLASAAGLHLVQPENEVAL